MAARSTVTIHRIHTPAVEVEQTPIGFLMDFFTKVQIPVTTQECPIPTDLPVTPEPSIPFQAFPLQST